MFDWARSYGPNPFLPRALIRRRFVFAARKKFGLTLGEKISDAAYAYPRRGTQCVDFATLEYIRT
jgi:hypothetical protein